VQQLGRRERPLSAKAGIPMFRHSRSRNRGQALVEFALVIPLFLLMLVGIFDLGRAVFSYNTLTNAAREGARLAIVNQYKPTIIQRAKDQTAITELNAPNVDVNFYQTKVDGTPDTARPCALVAVGCLAVVTFESTYQPITPIISNIMFKNGVTFTATAVLSVEFSCPLNPNDSVAAAACPKQP
jgi:Flp pilus assembly protein TadG